MKTEKKGVHIRPFVCLQELFFLTHAPFLRVCGLRGVLWHYRKSGSTSLGKRDKRVCVCSAEGKAICTQLSLIANTHEQKHHPCSIKPNCVLSACPPTCRSASGSVCHRASHFLVSPQLVARLVKRGYPSMQTPLISRRRQGGQHLPSCFAFLGWEEKSCCAVGETAWSTEQAHKNNRLDLENRLNRPKNLNKFACHLRRFGTYSFYSHRLLGEINTAIHLWQHNISTVITMIVHCFLYNYYS